MRDKYFYGALLAAIAIAIFVNVVLIPGFNLGVMIISAGLIGLVSGLVGVFLDEKNKSEDGEQKRNGDS